MTKLTREEILDLSSALDADMEILDDRPMLRDRVKVANGILVAMLATPALDNGVVLPAAYADAKAPPPAAANDAAPAAVPGESGETCEAAAQQA